MKYKTIIKYSKRTWFIYIYSYLVLFMTMEGYADTREQVL